MLGFRVRVGRGGGVWGYSAGSGSWCERAKMLSVSSSGRTEYSTLNPKLSPCGLQFYSFVVLKTQKGLKVIIF